MSQSWDNVASMHDHVTAHAHKHSPLVPCACADGIGLQRPHPSNLVCNGGVLALLEHRYRTTDRYDKEQTLAYQDCLHHSSLIL